MAVTKVFMLPIERGEYMGDGNFQLSIRWLMTTDVGPAYENGYSSINIPVESSPSTVYQLAYEEVLAQVAAFGWTTPAKSDMYTWTPLDFSLILPDEPPEAPATAAQAGQGPFGFLTALHQALSDEADKWKAKKDATAGSVIFLPPKPLMFDWFYPEG
jgi:hypothetical protein